MNMRTKVKRLKLRRMPNTRDLGGLPTADGRRVACGKLIRSGKLYNIPDATIEKLKSYGVSEIIDLRIDTEVSEHPNRLWQGVKYLHLPMQTTATPGITCEKTMRKTQEKQAERIGTEFESADKYMTAMYAFIFTSEYSKDTLKKILREIIENDGCILWHCSGGKDRAGIVAAIVESLLGVPEDVIIEDYAASKKFQRKSFFLHRLGLAIAPVRLRFKKILYALMATKPKYLADNLKMLNEKYGSVVNYCKKELSVTDDDIALLKKKYLE